MEVVEEVRELGKKIGSGTSLDGKSLVGFGVDLLRVVFGCWRYSWVLRFAFCVWFSWSSCFYSLYPCFLRVGYQSYHIHDVNVT